MTIYIRADRTSNITIANATYEIRSGRPEERAALVALEISLVTAATVTLGLGRPAAIGITPTSPQLVQALNSTDSAGTTATAMAWGTGPTVPAQFLKRWTFILAGPQTIHYQFVRPIIIPASGSLVLWNITASVLLDVNIVIDE